MDDVPTGQIIELLQPDVVLCFNTKHLSDFDIIADGWIHVALAYRDVARQQGVVVGIQLMGTLALQGTMGVTLLSIELLKHIPKQVLVGTALVLVGSGMIGFLLSPSRQWLIQRRQTIVNATKQYVDHMGEALGRIFASLSAIEQAAIAANQVLAAAKQRTIKRPDKVRAYATWVLARANGPLSLAEMVRRMKKAGYRTKAKHPERYLSRVLHAHPGLFRVEERRWSLGSQSTFIERSRHQIYTHRMTAGEGMPFQRWPSPKGVGDR